MTANYKNAVCDHAIALRILPGVRVSIAEFTAMFNMNDDAGYQRSRRMYTQDKLSMERVKGVTYYYATQEQWEALKSKPLRKKTPRAKRKYQSAEAAHEAKMSAYPDFNHVLHARFV